MGDSLVDLLFDALNYFFAAILGVFSTYFGRDGEAGRHGHAEEIHLGEVSTFAAKKIAVRCLAFSFAVAKCIDSFHF